MFNGRLGFPELIVMIVLFLAIRPIYRLIWAAIRYLERPQ
jgi:hypothetical protein